MRIFKKSTQNFYNQIAWIYPIGKFYFEDAKKYVESMFYIFPRKKKILDVGGVFSSQFLQTTHHDISGMDFSINMSKHLRDHYHQFFLHDVHLIDELNVDLEYDYIVLGFLISVIQDKKNVIDKLVKRLSPGGKIIIVNHFSDCQKLMGVYHQWAQRFARMMHFDYHVKFKDLETDSAQIQSYKCIDTNKKIFSVILKARDN